MPVLLGLLNVALTIAEPLEIRIMQDGPQVSFNFFRAQRKRRPAAQPTGITWLLVYSKSVTNTVQAQWLIYSQETTNAVEKATYGNVPDGFQQLVPKSGAPLMLQCGVVYFVEAQGTERGRTNFVYRCP